MAVGCDLGLILNHRQQFIHSDDEKRYKLITDTYGQNKLEKINQMGELGIILRNMF